MIGFKSLIVGLFLAHVAVADLDLSDNVYIQHMISSRAAPFTAPTYLPPVENLVCHGGDVCVQASECVNGYFSTELAYTKRTCDSNTEICCRYKPKPTPVPSIPCESAGFDCVSPNQCVNGEINIRGYNQKVADQCFAPEVCCRIPVESTVLEKDGYHVRIPETPFIIPSPTPPVYVPPRTPAPTPYVPPRTPAPIPHVPQTQPPVYLPPVTPAPHVPHPQPPTPHVPHPQPPTPHVPHPQPPVYLPPVTPAPHVPHPQPPTPHVPHPQPPTPHVPHPQPPTPHVPHPQPPTPHVPQPQPPVYLPPVTPAPHVPHPQPPTPHVPRPQPPTQHVPHPQPPVYLPPVIPQPTNQKPIVVVPTRPARPIVPTQAPIYLPPTPKRPSHQRGEDLLSEPIYKPKPTQIYLPPRPNQRGENILSEPIFKPSPQSCAAALKCTPIDFCTRQGVISKTPVNLTPNQELFRAPLTDCADAAAGIQEGKCCRDPDYVDPWPTSLLLTGQYDPTLFQQN